MKSEKEMSLDDETLLKYLRIKKSLLFNQFLFLNIFILSIVLSHKFFGGDNISNTLSDFITSLLRVITVVGLFPCTILYCVLIYGILKSKLKTIDLYILCLLSIINVIFMIFVYLVLK